VLPLPRHLLFDEIETVDWVQFRRDSERLELGRLGDFSWLDDVLSEVFDRTQGLVTCPIEVVAGACRDVGRLYDQSPTRDFQNVPAAARDALTDLYERSNIDEALAEVDRKAHAHNLVVIAVDPDGPRRVRLTSWVPYEIEAPVFSDPMETDIRRAERVELRVPTGVDESSTIYGRRVYTQSEAYVEAPGGKRWGIFNEEMTNPYPFIPLAVRREAEPSSKGVWFPALNESLLRLVETVTTSWADILKVCRHQCHIRQILTGSTGADPVKLQAGPDTVWFFRSHDDGSGGPSYSEHASAPPVAHFIDVLNELLLNYERFAGLTPGALTKSTAITGAGKAYELHGVERRVRERMRRAHRLESDLLDVIGAVAPMLTLAGTSPRLLVDYHLPKPEGNDLQAEQAFAVRMASGVDSPIERIMRSEGVDRAEATRRVESRMSDVENYGPTTVDVQGLDKTVPR